MSYEEPASGATNPFGFEYDAPSRKNTQLGEGVEVNTNDDASIDNFAYSSARTSVALDEGKSINTKLGVITVGEAELRGTNAFNKYHAYKVTCSSGTVEHVFRRYKDFVWLRGVLVKLFPGIFIPPLPPKHILGNKDEQVIVERQQDLTRFLNRVASRSFLADSEPFQTFLTRAHTFEEAGKEIEKQIDARSLHDVLSMYQELFPEIVHKSLSDSAEGEVEGLKEFLSLTEQKLDGLTSTSASLAKNVDKMAEDIQKLNGFLVQTYDNERGYPRIPGPPRVDVMEAFVTWQTAQKQSAQSFTDNLSITFKHELQDIRAMIELCKYRIDLSKRHQKTKLKSDSWSDPKSAPKNEKQEQQKTIDNQQEKDEKELLDIVTKLILTSQVELFWRARMKTFKEQIHQFAANQVAAQQQVLNTFQKIVQITEQTQD